MSFPDIFSQLCNKIGHDKVIIVTKQDILHNETNKE